MKKMPLSVTLKITVEPFYRLKISRMGAGTVTCPLDVIVAISMISMNTPYILIFLHYLHLSNLSINPPGSSFLFTETLFFMDKKMGEHA